MMYRLTCGIKDVVVFNSFYLNQMQQPGGIANERASSWRAVFTRSSFSKDPPLFGLLTSISNLTMSKHITIMVDITIFDRTIGISQFDIDL